VNFTQEPLVRFERTTARLRIGCSTTELQRRNGYLLKSHSVPKLYPIRLSPAFEENGVSILLHGNDLRSASKPRGQPVGDDRLSRLNVSGTRSSCTAPLGPWIGHAKISVRVAGIPAQSVPKVNLCEFRGGATWNIAHRPPQRPVARLMTVEGAR
jgi:hypothetical protein